MDSILPMFGNGIFTLVAFVVALSVIVAIHEYGHYIIGRLSGIHAEVFSIGFGRVLIQRTDKHGTVWQIAALPFGGYVRFLGDANAASAGADDEVIEALSPEDQRRTLNGAPLWARTATVAAGPIFNFILSFFIFAGLFYWSGKPAEPLVIEAVKPLPPEVSGLQAVDRLIAIGGIETPDMAGYGEAVRNATRSSVVKYTVERAGDVVAVDGPYPFLPYVAGFTDPSAAEQAGVQVGDIVTAVDDTEIVTFPDLLAAVAEAQSTPVDVTVWRDGAYHTMEMTAREQDVPLANGDFEKRYLIGVTVGDFLTLETSRPSILEAAGIGIDRTYSVLRSSLKGVYFMITGAISTCNISGPLAIAEVSGEAARMGPESFIFLIGFLSAAVGLMNLFPIPVLDGGHLVFYAFEAVVGRPPKPGAMRILMTVGLVMVLTLMVFGLSNDLFCP